MNNGFFVEYLLYCIVDIFTREVEVELFDLYY